MKNPKYSNAAVNAEADALGATLNNGYLRIYTGEQPEDVDAPITTQKKLAELRFGFTAFAPALKGTITANAMKADMDAPAGGVPTWFRCLKSDGVTAIHDGSIGGEDADMIWPTDPVQVLKHAEVSLTSMTIMLPKSTKP